MKFIVLIGDGMGDYPRADLGGKTALEAANTPNMDWIAANGKGGFAQTIPESMQSGSDVANMEIIGYDTTETFTGRAVFEALSMGHHLGSEDVAFRANFVTLENGKMKDYSADHITTEEAVELINILDDKLGTDTIRFYPGISYRHIMVWKGGKDSMETTPPHDIIDREYKPYLPHGEGADEINGIMEQSRKILEDTVVNKKRETLEKLPASSIWFWGQGRNLTLSAIEEKYGVKGGVISAVDLIRGIGVAAGLKPIFVPGATGYIDTNYIGKAEAALSALKTMDFVYVHVEAPDEAAHNGDIDMKIKAIEDFDSKVVGTILDGLKDNDEAAVLVTCDHRTPVETRTHTREPVPFAYVGPGIETDSMKVFSENGADSGSIKIVNGHELLNIFIGDFISL
ncbi:cofactor-independent phosphoglycerate mutase [Candidatus Latescibacterota bacterium]